MQNPQDPRSVRGLMLYVTEQVKTAALQPPFQLPVANQYHCNLVLTHSLNVVPLNF